MTEDDRTIHLFQHNDKQFMVDAQWKAADGGVEITFNRDAHVWHGTVSRAAIQELTQRARWTEKDVISAMRAAVSGSKRTDKSHHVYFIKIREQDEDPTTRLPHTIKVHWYIQKRGAATKAQLFNRCVLKLNTAQSPQLALAHLYSETVRLKNKLSELQDVQEGERDNWQSAYDELHTAIDEGLQQERTVISFGRALLLAKDRRLADLQAAASRAESRVGSLESAATSQPQSQSQSQSQSRPHSRQSHYSTPSLPSSHEASSVATQHVQRTQQSRTPASTPASRPSTANTTASTMSPSQALRPSLQSSASTDLDLAPSPVRAATSPRKKRFIRRTGTIGTLTRKAGGGGGGANASGRTTAAASSTTSASFVKSLHFSRDRQADDDGAETTKRPKITPAKDAVVAADPSAVSPQDDERLLEEL